MLVLLVHRVSIADLITNMPKRQEGTYCVMQTHISSPLTGHTKLMQEPLSAGYVILVKSMLSTWFESMSCIPRGRPFHSYIPLYTEPHLFYSVVVSC